MRSPSVATEPTSHAGGSHRHTVTAERIARCYGLASSMTLETGIGMDVAERAAAIRREGAQRLRADMPKKLLQPDELSERATYFFVHHRDSVVATARVVPDRPLDDIAYTVLTSHELARLQGLHATGQLQSISRLMSTVGGQVGAAASWVVYRALLLDGLPHDLFYVSEIRTALRRRLLGIGVNSTPVGVTSIPGFEVEPVVFDVRQIVTDSLRTQSGFGRFLDDALQIDLRPVQPPE